jgi:hypothetical protein
MSHASTRWLVLAALALPLGIATAACGGDDDPEQTPDAADPVPDASTAPAISAEIAPDAFNAGDPVTVEVTLANYTLVNPTSQPAPIAMPGEGHYHYFIDALEDDYAAAWTESFEITAPDAAGVHTVRMYLVDSDHMPVIPPAQATAEFTVE